MIRTGIVLVALAAVFVFNGCSSPKPDDIVKDSIRQWEEAAQILEGLVDEAGLVDASRRLDAMAQKMADTNKKFAGLKLKDEDARTLESENRKEIATALTRFNEAAKRVKSIPGGAAAIDRFQRQATRTF